MAKIRQLGWRLARSQLENAFRDFSVFFFKLLILL
jgi:hypothetical protein